MPIKLGVNSFVYSVNAFLVSRERAFISARCLFAKCNSMHSSVAEAAISTAALRTGMCID